MSTYQGPYAPDRQPARDSAPPSPPKGQQSNPFPGANSTNYNQRTNGHSSSSYGMPYPYSQGYGRSYKAREPKRAMDRDTVTRRPKGMLEKMVPKFILGQQVEICISGNAWLLGIIVGALKLADKVTGGLGYDVRYNLSGRTRTDVFMEDDIREVYH